MKVAELYGELGLRDTGYFTTLDRAEMRGKQFSAATSRQLDQIAAGQKLAATGRRMTLGVTVPLGLAAAASVKLAGDFTKTMNTMGAVAGVPAPELEKLRGLAVQLGKDTVFSTNEAAQGMLELAKAGISTEDIMGGALKNALDLATAGDLDLASASSIAATAMSVFGLSGKESQQAVDALAGAANASQANVSDLSQALAQGAQAAANAGLSVQETTGALAAFAKAGLMGSDAGTSLKTFLLNLVPTTKRASEEMNKYNLSFVDANGNIMGLTEIAGQLTDKLGDLTQAEQQAALKIMFGTDAYRAASVIMENGAAGLQNYIDQTSKVGNAADVAKAKMEGWPGVLETLSGSMETAGLIAGEILIPPLELLATGMTGLLNLFIDAPTPIKFFVVGLGAVAAAAGPTIWAVGKLTAAVQFFVATTGAGIVSLSGFQVALGSLAVGVGAALPFLGAAGAAGAFVAMGFAIDEAVERMNDFIPAWGSLVEEILTKVPFVGQAFDMVFDTADATQDKNDEAGASFKLMGSRIDLAGKAIERRFDSVAGSVKVFAEVFGKSTDNAADKVRVFAGMTQKQYGKWEADTVGNFNTVEGALGRLAEKHNVTADQILRAFRRALRAQAEFGKNWKDVVKRSGDDADSLLAYIQENFGAQAPAIVAALADANDKEFKKIIKMWNTGGAEAADLANAVAGPMGRIKGDLSGTGREAEAAKGAVQRLYGSLKNLENVADIKVNIGGPTGDGIGVMGSGGGMAAGWAQQAMAAVPGAQSASGFRPNSITASGNLSLHSDPNNPAQDISGDNLMGIAMYAAAHWGQNIRELIYTPLGWGIKNGQRVGLDFWGDTVNSMHYTHVHLADRGGTIPGPAMIRQGPVMESHIPHNAYGEEMLARAVARAMALNGGSSSPQIYAPMTVQGHVVNEDHLVDKFERGVNARRRLFRGRTPGVRA